MTKMRLGPITSMAEKLLMRIGICPIHVHISECRLYTIKKALTKRERRVIRVIRESNLAVYFHGFRLAVLERCRHGLDDGGI